MAAHTYAVNADPTHLEAGGPCLRFHGGTGRFVSDSEHLEPGGGRGRVAAFRRREEGPSLGDLVEAEAGIEPASGPKNPWKPSRLAGSRTCRLQLGYRFGGERSGSTGRSIRSTNSSVNAQGGIELTRRIAAFSTPRGWSEVASGSLVRSQSWSRPIGGGTQLAPPPTPPLERAAGTRPGVLTPGRDGARWEAVARERGERFALRGRGSLAQLGRESRPRSISAPAPSTRTTSASSAEGESEGTTVVGAGPA